MIGGNQINPSFSLEQLRYCPLLKYASAMRGVAAAIILLIKNEWQIFQLIDENWLSVSDVCISEDITFDNAPSPQNPPIHRDAVIECRVSAEPRAEVSWRYNGSPIRPSTSQFVRVHNVIITVRLRMHTHGHAIDVCLSVCPSVKRVDCDKTK